MGKTYKLSAHVLSRRIRSTPRLVNCNASKNDNGEEIPRTMGAKADLANLQLLALRVARRLVRDEFVIAEHVQQRRLAGIVEAEKENASLLVVEAEGRQKAEKPEERSTSM